MGNMARVTAPKSSTGHVIRDSALGLVPETLDGLIALNSDVWAGGPVTPSLLEIIRLRNARTVNCVFCRSVRYDIARQDGLTEDRVDQIKDGYENSQLSDAEKLVLAFVDVYLKDPHSMTKALMASLKKHFSDQQIAVMAVALATFNASSRCAVSLGGMPESLPVTEISIPR